MENNRAAKKIFYFVIAIVVIAATIGIFAISGQKVEAPVTNNNTNQRNVDKYADLIQVSEPKAGDQVRSPIRILGKARGTWFFEASFPIEIVSEDGKVLAQGYASSLGDWMTTEFVPFLAEIEISGIGDQNVNIVLKKDNPSGLPEHDAQIEIPVYIAVY